MSKAQKNLAGYKYHPFLIMKSRIKDCVQEEGLECSEKTFEALNSKFASILYDGIKRAKENARKRFLKRDI